MVPAALWSRVCLLRRGGRPTFPPEKQISPRVSARTGPHAPHLSLSVSTSVPMRYSSTISTTLDGCCGPWNPFELSALRKTGGGARRARERVSEAQRTVSVPARGLGRPRSGDRRGSVPRRGA